MEGSSIEERPATLGARLRLRVPPDPQLGRYVREQIIAFASALEIPETDLADFLTALGEALANAMEHSGAREPIEVSVWLVGGDQLGATVVDRGVGFVPAGAAELAEPNLPDSFSERGRGLPIMRRCSDIFSVRSTPGKGTAVTLGRFVNRGEDRLRYAAG
jgi:anti-sigma regulatory factor (Ser/Thr protein kinase)